MDEREKVIEMLEYSWEYIRERPNPTATPKARAMGGIRKAISLLKNSPDIVRCKDCTYYLPLVHSCQHLPATVANPNGFCSDGKRREVSDDE